MVRIDVQTAKAQLEELIDAALRGEEVAITTNDELDEVRLVATVKNRAPAQPPYRKAGSAKGEIRFAEYADLEQPGPTFGSAKGRLWVSEDFDEPLEDLLPYMYADDEEPPAITIKGTSHEDSRNR
jgi:antitoxin (DNA-binding transcriptional repressor) of toxin-antitoxin stability system